MVLAEEEPPRHLSQPAITPPLKQSGFTKPGGGQDSHAKQSVSVFFLGGPLRSAKQGVSENLVGK